MNDYEWDAAKRRENRENHGVDFSEIQNFEWDAAMYNESPRRGEPRWMATAYIGTRRHTVVYTIRGDKSASSACVSPATGRGETMPQLKPGDVPLTDEENAAVLAGIAADPDTCEPDAEWFATAKRYWELPHEVRWLRRKRERAQQRKAWEVYGMSTVGIDHIAMPTADAERLMAFYKKLGFAINDENEWRAGTANIFSIQIGDSKINVHPEGYIADYRGPTAVPGCTDICFVWNGTVEQCQQMLAEAGVEVVRGPGPRKGARQRGALPAVSLYARDPDNNLLEWMIYQ